MPKYGYLGPRPLKLENDAILLFQKKELSKTLPTSPQPFSQHNSTPRYTYKRFLVLFLRFWSVNQISCIQKQKKVILKLVTISMFIVFQSGCSRREGLSKSHNSRLTWLFVAIYISILLNLSLLPLVKFIFNCTRNHAIISTYTIYKLLIDLGLRRKELTVLKGSYKVNTS